MTDNEYYIFYMSLNFLNDMRIEEIIQIIFRVVYGIYAFAIR